MTWTKPQLVVPKQHSGGPQHAAGSCLRLSSPATGWKSEPQSKLYDTNFHHKWFWQNYCIFMKQFLQIHANTHMCKRTHTHTKATHMHTETHSYKRHTYTNNTHVCTLTHTQTHTQSMTQPNSYRTTPRKTQSDAQVHMHTLMQTH